MARTISIANRRVTKVNRIEFLRDGERALVRRSWAAAEVAAALGIDPAVEVAAQRLAAEVGIAPPVIHFDVEQRMMLMPFVDGHPLETDWIHRAERRAAMYELLSQLRTIVAGALPRIDLLSRARELHSRLARVDPAAALRHQMNLGGELTEVESAGVLVHGDLTPENIIVRADGSLCLIDWEYAHQGHADEDLAGLLPTSVPTPSWAIDWAIRSDQLPQRIGIRRLLDGLWLDLAAALQRAE